MIFDIHCHASLKQFLFGDAIADRHPFVIPDFSPFGMHADLHTMKKGGLRTVVCAHYLPEYGFREAEILGIPVRWLLDTIYALRSKSEDRSSKTKPFEQTMDIINDFENEIAEANTLGFSIAIAKTFGELRQGLDDGKLMFLHSIEGAHSLGWDLSEQELKRHIDILVQRGLCQFTLAHFFDNQIVPSQGGIPPSLRTTLQLETLRQPSAGLTPVGKKIVQYLLDRGIIIDMVHCTPKARQEILQINNERNIPRPIVLSHTGLRSIAAEGDLQQYQNDCEFLPSDEEVKQIIRTRGVLGILFMNYWINGVEEDHLINRDIGIPDIIRTMKKIQSLEKEVDAGYDCDHCCIGTDFDGFTQVPDDLNTAAEIPDLFSAMRNDGFTGEQIEKIAWKNYLRVLETGWNTSP